MLSVSSVVTDSDFHLTLIFSNGEQRRFDMRSYLHLPVYRPLNQPGYFALAKVNYGTVVWPGEIDIAPETLFDHSVPFGQVVQT